MKRRICALICAVIVGVVAALALSGCNRSSAGDWSKDFGTDFLAGATVTKTQDGGREYRLPAAQEVDTIIVREKTDNVARFLIRVKEEGSREWQTVYQQDRIGAYRICRLDRSYRIEELKLEIAEKYDASASVELSDAGAFMLAGTLAKREDFRVVDYLRIDGDIFQGREDDLRGYLSCVSDVIILGTVSFGADGKLVYSEGKQTFAEKIAFLRACAGERRINVTVSVGVKQKDNDATRKYIDKYLDTMAQELQAFVSDNRLDGIDYDWEYPENLFQWNAYDALVKKSCEIMHASGRTVSVALAPWGCGFSKTVSQKIDYVNLMSYDLFDERGEHAGYYHTTVEAVNEILNKSHFQPEQICLGLSFYGRTADRSGNAWPDYYWDYVSNGASLGKWGNRIPDFQYRDEEGNLCESDGYVNGYAMNRDKTAYAYAHELGGVMIFRALCDSPYAYEYSLHKAVAQTLSALGGTPSIS